MAFHHTHGMDTVITRCSNNYGPYQFPEKLIPLMILNAFDGKPLPVYGDGMYVRDWIHVEDHCEAVDAGADRRARGRGLQHRRRQRAPQPGRRARDPAPAGRDESLIRHVPDRPGHDRRYAMNSTKIREALGWRPRHVFEEGLAETVAWYRANSAWTERRAQRRVPRLLRSAVRGAPGRGREALS